MLTKENFVDIHARFKQGQSIRRIARELDISRNTVRKHLAQHQMPVYTPRAAKPTKLEAFQSYLQQRIEHAKPHWIPASVLFHEIREQGYQGGVAMLRRYVSQFKTATAEPLVRFETPAGEQMQIDFTTIRRGKNTLKAFVATLSYSRACFVKFFDNEQAAVWQQGLKEALDFFGGVPQTILCDNAKALIIQRHAYGEGLHKWHPDMLQMAKDYGFKLRACRPYRAQTKGKVERFNHYLKNSFVLPLATTLKEQGLLLDVTLANAKVGAWLQNVAHQRIHGTTKEKPADRLAHEVGYLQPLPTMLTSASIPDMTVRRVPPSAHLQHSMAVYESLLGGDDVAA